MITSGLSITFPIRNTASASSTLSTITPVISATATPAVTPPISSPLDPILDTASSPRLSVLQSSDSPSETMENESGIDNTNVDMSPATPSTNQQPRQSENMPETSASAVTDDTTKDASVSALQTETTVKDEKIQPTQTISITKDKSIMPTPPPSRNTTIHRKPTSRDTKRVSSRGSSRKSPAQRPKSSANTSKASTPLAPEPEDAYVPSELVESLLPAFGAYVSMPSTTPLIAVETVGSYTSAAVSYRLNICALDFM